MTARWIAFGVACLVVATAAFGAGAGTIALFSDTETISGSFSVEDDRDHRFGPWSENGTDPEGENGSEQGAVGNESGPANGTSGGNGTAGGNGSVADDGTIGGNATDGTNGTADGGNGTGGAGGSGAGDGNTTDGGNATDAGNATDDGDPGNGTDGDASGASVTVTSVELGNSEVVVGEASDVLVTVRNDRNVTASFTAGLTVDGSEADSGTIQLAPGEASTLTLSHTFQSTGNVTVRAAGIDAGTVSVVAPDLAVVDAATGTATVGVDESVTATAVVANDGTASGTKQVALTVDGTVVETASATVPQGNSETVSFSHTFGSEGTYALAVDGVSAGTVEVVGPSNATSAAGSAG